MQQSDPRMLVIALQGLPITLAILLSMEHQPVTEKHLCAMLSRTDKTIAAALHKLKEFQIITRTTQGWTISTNAQLPLMGLQEGVDNLWKKNRNNSDFPNSSSSSLYKNQIENTVELLPEESELFRLLKIACIESGIREPKASKIAVLPGMTKGIIEAHVDQALAEGQTVGAAIYRLEHGWPIEEKLSEADKRQRKYAGKNGEYLHCFEH